jgi:hypothetical protein
VGGFDVPEGTQITPEAAFLFAWQASHGRESKPPDATWERFRSLLERGEGGAR